MVPGTSEKFSIHRPNNKNLTERKIPLARSCMSPGHVLSSVFSQRWSTAEGNRKEHHSLPLRQQALSFSLHLNACPLFSGPRRREVTGWWSQCTLSFVPGSLLEPQHQFSLAGRRFCSVEPSSVSFHTQLFLNPTRPLGQGSSLSFPVTVVAQYSQHLLPGLRCAKFLRVGPLGAPQLSC